MLKATKLVLVAAALTTIGAVSYAAKSGESEAAGIEQAKISLSQAIATAEQHAGGKATRAEFEKTKAGISAFDVEVVNGANTFDVSVDANTGTVISSAQDKMDGDRDSEGDQEKDD
jgi:uncharacterized membrane protein YkoI